MMLTPSHRQKHLFWRFLLGTLLAMASVLVGIPSKEASAAATYYVSTTGNDANPGTSVSPFRTIQKGADVVSPGDTVVVTDGTYADNNGSEIVYVRRGGTASAWVTFRALTRWGAHLQAPVTHGFYISADYVRIEGFDISGQLGDDAHGASGVESFNTSYVQLLHNHLHDIGHRCTDTSYGFAGVYFHGGSNWTIEGNIFHDIGRFGPGENGCTPTNEYYKNHDHGVYMDGGTNVVIQNNLFYRHLRGYAITIYPAASTAIQIRHNTFALANPYWGGHLDLSSSISDSAIANNIFYQPTTTALVSCCGASFSNVQVKNNLTYGGKIGDPLSGVTFTANIDNTDPKFVSASTNDFHLQTGSPAIDTGASLTEVTTDYDGVSRPQGAGYDMGAYEYTSKPSVSLSISGLPPGASASFSPSSCSPSCISNLTLNTSLSTPAGIYTITVTGTGGSVTKTTAFKLTVSAPTSTGNTYYVATTGNDANPGNAGAPWKTIQKAANTLQAGDTVYIRGGTYQERVVINVSGTSGNYITFQNYASESVTVNGNKSLPSTRGSGLIEINSKSYIKLIGLKVTNSSSYGIKNNGQYITIQNCEVSYSNDGGIVSEALANNLTIDGCDVHHNNDIGLSAWHEAVTMSGVNTFEVKNSQVHDNKEEGIVAKYDATNGSIHHNKSFSNNGPNIYLDGPSNIKIYNNEVHTTLGAKAGIGLSIENNDANGQTGNISIYNNLIYDNAAGIWFWTETVDSTKLFSGITIVNNIIYNNNRNVWGGVYLMSGGSSNYSNVAIRNNIFWENTLSGGRSIKGATSVLSTFAIDHNLFKTGESSDAFGTSNVTTSDVLWVNKANNDFRLQSISPAIDAGVALPEVPTDFDDISRPQGAAYDIGAYEYAF